MDQLVPIVHMDFKSFGLEDLMLKSNVHCPLCLNVNQSFSRKLLHVDFLFKPIIHMRIQSFRPKGLHVDPQCSLLDAKWTLMNTQQPSMNTQWPSMNIQ